ncbi:MAG: hypothetical protein U1A72_23230 [Sulfuritalea sp.]|nr:hypothetical protein [Sulfuritalea sp.]
MPFGYAGHCYSSSAEALEAFSKSFPILGDTAWVWLTGSSIDAAGVVSYNVVTKPTTANNVTARSGTIQLAPCSTPDAPVFDPVAAGGIFAFFFLGVAGTWVVSQNVGLILEAIKKW